MLALISGAASETRVVSNYKSAYSRPIFRWSFNITLLIIGVFATAAGASPNYIVLCSLAAVWSVGVGGNLPVDSAVFLGKRHLLFATLLFPVLYTNVTPIEFVPASHQYLLTVLSVWWAFGQLIGSLVRPDIRSFFGG